MCWPTRTRGLTPAELGRVAEQGSLITKMASTGTPRQYRETVEQIVGQARNDDGLGAWPGSVGHRGCAGGPIRTACGIWPAASTQCAVSKSKAGCGTRLRPCSTTSLRMTHPPIRSNVRSSSPPRHSCRSCEGKAGSSDLPDVTVLIDERTLLEGRRHESSVIDAGLGRFGLPVETVRRWACIGKVTPVVVGADGVRLYLGRGPGSRTGLNVERYA